MIYLKDQRQRTKREETTPAASTSFRKNSNQLEPWYKASRYVSEKLRFVKKYISIIPGPTGINELLPGFLESQVNSFLVCFIQDLRDRRGHLEPPDQLVNDDEIAMGEFNFP